MNLKQRLLWTSTCCCFFRRDRRIIYFMLFLCITTTGTVLYSRLYFMFFFWPTTSSPDLKWSVFLLGFSGFKSSWGSECPIVVQMDVFVVLSLTCASEMNKVVTPSTQLCTMHSMLAALLTTLSHDIHALILNHLQVPVSKVITCAIFIYGTRVQRI